jgi:hypothetical protein
MSKYPGNERRRIQRTKLVTNSLAHFTYQNKSYEALMCDVSELGAGFRIDSENAGLKIKRNDQVEFAIKTPYGDSTCKGKIAWFGHPGHSCSWGIEITELSKDEKDPLRCLMDSPF